MLSPRTTAYQVLVNRVVNQLKRAFIRTRPFTDDEMQTIESVVAVQLKRHETQVELDAPVLDTLIEVLLNAPNDGLLNHYLRLNQIIDRLQCNANTDQDILIALYKARELAETTILQLLELRNNDALNPMLAAQPHYQAALHSIRKVGLQTWSGKKSEFFQLGE